MSNVDPNKLAAVINSTTEIQVNQGHRLEGVLKDMKDIEASARSAGEKIATTGTALNESFSKLDPHTDIAVKEISTEQRSKSTKEGGY